VAKAKVAILTLHKFRFIQDLYEELLIEEEKPIWINNKKT